MCQFSVICDQQKPLGIFIQTSDREQIFPFLFRDQIDHGRLMPVFACRDHPGRFVQHIIFHRHISDPTSLKANLIQSRIDFLFRFFYCLAVDFGQSFYDRFFHFTAASHAHFRQILIQSYFHFGLLPAISSSAPYDCHLQPGRYLFFNVWDASFPKPSG